MPSTAGEALSVYAFALPEMLVSNALTTVNSRGRWLTALGTLDCHINELPNDFFVHWLGRELAGSSLPVDCFTDAHLISSRSDYLQYELDTNGQV
jgi:hypothetical protein